MTEADRALVADVPRDASAALPPGCQESFARLAKLIRARPKKFQLLILDCRDEQLRERLIKDLDDSLHVAGRHTARLRLSLRDDPDFATVERALIASAETSSAIHVTGGPAWFDAPRWEEFNIRRESVAHEVRASLLLWLDPDSIADLARIAIDLWAWRAAVVTFATAPQRPSRPEPDFRVIDGRTRSERATRIEFLRQVLLEPDVPDELRAEFALEIGDLAVSVGQIADAELAYRDAALAATDEHPRAIAAGRIADILRARGELDEALRIRREEELPVYDRLGDVRGRMVTLYKIAASLFGMRGLDDARAWVIYDAASEAFAVARRMNLADGIAHTGVLLARVLLKAGRSSEAVLVLDEAEAAFARLGDAAGIKRVKGIRAMLTPPTQ